MGEIPVRFLVNTASKKILYMEAGKGLVDLLLGFLQLPVAIILNIFKREAEPASAKMEVGSITNIYESLQRMSNSCLLVPKDGLLKPPSSLQLSRESPTLLLPSLIAHPSNVFRCNRNLNHLSHVSMVSGIDCKHCASSSYRGSMTSAMVIEDAAAGTVARSEVVEGYVQPYLSFIVTDELRILPASTIESIVLLNKLKVERLSDLDSFETVISPDEALELLKVSFTTRTALNQVFSAKIPARA